jgi:molybdopterin-guanine dinucleotide biosynthesis protein A
LTPTNAAECRSPITGVVLAGGQGRRMGGVDKGLKLLRGKPMVLWVIERFAPQVDEIIVNANQNLDAYRAFGHRVVPDAIGGYVGPLAGLHRGLSEARHELVATVPCDSPFLPSDLVARLGSALESWYAALNVVEVRFDDEADAFSNINTETELRSFESS